MAFSLSRFARLSTHANSDAGVTWEYKEDEAIATIAGSGYFNAVANQLVIGDLIAIHANNGAGLRRVTAVSPAVTVTNIN